MAALSAYLAKNASDGLAWFALARLRLKAGTPETEAIDALTRAKAAGFKDGQAAQALAELPGLVLSGEAKALLQSIGP
jgi:hypothetical protein